LDDGLMEQQEASEKLINVGVAKGKLFPMSSH
jgi:hypothetical protein